MEEMSERWKPEKGEMYFYISNVLMVTDDVVNGYSHLDEERIAAGNCFATFVEAQAAAEKVKALLLSLHDNGTSTANSETLKGTFIEYLKKCAEQPVTDCSQLPKLTAEVFDRPDCPEWAKYAAVDRDGIACFYDQEPKCDNMQMWLRGKNGEHFMATGNNKYDASDWQHSLIKRPEKKTLPDWCKVGEWVWLDPQKIAGANGYEKVTNVDGFGLMFESGLMVCFSHRILQARLRPYNTDEMRELVGKIAKSETGDVSIIDDYSSRDEDVYICDAWYSANMLLQSKWRLDGKPCGVLEHFKNGAWVE
jgi:hypothetical protein